MRPGKKIRVAGCIENFRVAQLAAADKTLRIPIQLDILDCFIAPVSPFNVRDAA